MAISACAGFSYYLFFLFSLLPLAYNRDGGNHSNRNPSTSNNQRTILFLFQNEAKKFFFFALFSTHNVMHYGHLLRSCSFWGRSWFGWLIAGGSRSSPFCVRWMHTEKDRSLTASWSRQQCFIFLSQQQRIAVGISQGCSAGLGWVAATQNTTATLCFVVTHAPLLCLFSVPLLTPKITSLSDF